MSLVAAPFKRAITSAADMLSGKVQGGMYRSSCLMDAVDTQFILLLVLDFAHCVMDGCGGTSLAKAGRTAVKRQAAVSREGRARLVGHHDGSCLRLGFLFARGERSGC